MSLCRKGTLWGHLVELSKGTDPVRYSNTLEQHIQLELTDSQWRLSGPRFHQYPDGGPNVLED